MINNPRIRVYPHLKLPNGDLPTSTSKYWYFHVFDEDFETSLMEVRMTQDGYWGELVWLQKGRRVSGTEVRGVLFFEGCPYAVCYGHTRKKRAQCRLVDFVAKVVFFAK